MSKNNRHMSKKLDIVGLYLSDYGASFSGREISRLIRVSPQTALSILAQLVEGKMLNVTKEGRNNKYRLNKKDLKTKLFLEMTETNKARSFLEKFELKLILNKMLPLAETIIVFGSFAKKREKESSDLDLIIIGAKGKNKIMELKRIFPREINIEFAAWNTFAKTLTEKNALALEIKKSHLIYGNVFKVVDIYCR